MCFAMGFWVYVLPQYLHVPFVLFDTWFTFLSFISKPQWKTLTVGIMGMVGMYATNWGALGAGLVVATVPTLIIYLLMSGEIQKSFTTGALKG